MERTYDKSRSIENIHLLYVEGVFDLHMAPTNIMQTTLCVTKYFKAGELFSRIFYTKYYILSLFD